MATLYTDQSLIESAGPNLENRAKTAAQVGRGVQMKEVRYTTTGAEADADVINICALPIGAKVIPHLCRVITEAIGGTGSAVSKIGDAGDDDRYSATSIALTSAASIAVTPAAAITSSYAIASGNEIVKGTFALTSGTVTAAKTVIFQIAYINP